MSDCSGTVCCRVPEYGMNIQFKGGRIPILLSDLALLTQRLLFLRNACDRMVSWVFLSAFISTDREF